MSVYLAAFAKLYKPLSQCTNLGHPLLFAWCSSTLSAFSMAWSFAMSVGSLGSFGPESSPAVTLLRLCLNISGLYLGTNILSGYGISHFACLLSIRVDPNAAFSDAHLQSSQPALCCET
jgi:hypothetical protein